MTQTTFIDTHTPADARCSSGKAQAGGFGGPPPRVGAASSYFVADSFRIDKKTWRTRMLSDEPGGTLTSYVYCADEKKPSTRTGSTSAVGTAAFGTALSAECKRGTKPVAGGFSQPDATNAPDVGRFSYVHELRKIGKRWQASARHAGTVATTLNAFVYCR